jgi:aryl-alcohol dehydrogenase-like predicted oxidoreductase
VLDQPGISSAIIGASRPSQLAANLAAPKLAIDEELARVLDETWWSLPRRRVDEGYR